MEMDELKIRPTVNGHLQFGQYLECSPGEGFQIEQEIQEWPFAMDTDYLKAIRPQGLLRQSDQLMQCLSLIHI